MKTENEKTDKKHPNFEIIFLIMTIIGTILTLLENITNVWNKEIHDKIENLSMGALIWQMIHLIGIALIVFAICYYTINRGINKLKNKIPNNLDSEIEKLTEINATLQKDVAGLKSELSLNKEVAEYRATQLYLLYQGKTIIEGTFPNNLKEVITNNTREREKERAYFRNEWTNRYKSHKTIQEIDDLINKHCIYESDRNL